ncbi:hypothetical protein [Arthrobacter tecti]
MFGHATLRELAEQLMATPGRHRELPEDDGPRDFVRIFVALRVGVSGTRPGSLRPTSLTSSARAGAAFYRGAPDNFLLTDHFAC